MMLFPPVLAAPMKYLPVAVVQRATSIMLAQLVKRHPGLFERLGEHRAKRYAFLPADIPFAFVVEPSGPSITVSRDRADAKADASVSGPLFMLLSLMEGRQDADALFFSRDLSVTGDMEAMLALRNALDDSGIDLPKDLGAVAGPLAPVVSRAASAMRGRILAGEAASWN